MALLCTVGDVRASVQWAQMWLAQRVTKVQADAPAPVHMSWRTSARSQSRRLPHCMRPRPLCCKRRSWPRTAMHERAVGCG